jgi:putative transcriptional regulator
MPKLRSGVLLVARPSLVDQNFRHAVVLLFRHESEAGSMGLIVNRKSSVKLAGSLGNVSGATGRDDRVWIGGPVQQNSVWVLHRRSDVDDRGLEVVPGIYLGGSPQLLRALLTTTPVNPAPGVFRVVQGYAGWGEGQLQNEIKEGAWRIADPDPDLVFGTEADDLWDDVLTRAQLPFRLPPDTLRNARHN